MSNCNRCARPCYRPLSPLDLLRRPCYLAPVGTPTPPGTGPVPGRPFYPPTVSPTVPPQQPTPPPSTPSPVPLPPSPPMPQPPVPLPPTQPEVPPPVSLPPPQVNPTPSPAPPTASLADLIIAEQNFARQQPREYVAIVQQTVQNNPSLITAEPASLSEAITFLNTVTPCVSTLERDPTLDTLAQNWVNTAGGAGIVGHGDFAARVQQALATGRYSSLAENLAYGYTDARIIVVAWILDAGLPDRGHRNNIFNCNFDSIGVGSGPFNGVYNFMVSNVYGDNVSR